MHLFIGVNWMQAYQIPGGYLHTDNEDGYTKVAGILDVQCTLMTSATTGPVPDGYIDLECWLIPVDEVVFWDRSERLPCWNLKIGSDVIDFLLDDGSMNANLLKSAQCPFYLVPFFCRSPHMTGGIVLTPAKSQPECMICVGSWYVVVSKGVSFSVT
jgi:hypothetical protein